MGIYYTVLSTFVCFQFFHRVFKREKKSRASSIMTLPVPITRLQQLLILGPPKNRKFSNSVMVLTVENLFLIYVVTKF